MKVPCDAMLFCF